MKEDDCLVGHIVHGCVAPVPDAFSFTATLDPSVQMLCPDLSGERLSAISPFWNTNLLALSFRVGKARFVYAQL